MCRPLAREVLGRCLDLEFRERAVCWSNRTRSNPHTEALVRWQEFRTDVAHYARVFYPSDCPAEPGDSWPFTTFGEFLWATDPRSSQLAAWRDLRDLRNGLAHGHYLCWRAIIRLLEIEGRLEP